MIAARDLKRFRNTAQAILNTKDVEAIEDRKIAAVRRLRRLGEESEPIEFAETQFELACCYLLRHDRRVKGRQLRQAEDHYNLALSALSGPVYASERAIIQSELAEGYNRLRSKNALRDTARDKTDTLLRAAAASFLEADEPVDAAVAYTRLAELWLEGGSGAVVLAFRDQALSLAQGTVKEADLEKVTDLLDRLFRLQDGLAESANRKLLVDQENFGIVSARQAVTEVDPRFNEIPHHLIDELFQAVDDASGRLDPAFVYSLGSLVESHRRRGTLYAFPPPRDPDLSVLDSISGVPGLELRHLASRYRNARTSPLGYAIVPVYYATDRVPTGEGPLDNCFGNGRDPGFSPSLSFGLSHVSIPRDHRTGSLEAPKLWKFEFKLRPEKHVTVLSVQPLKRNPFFSRFDSDLAARADGAALLFIHGYNVTFSDALKRTAQLCYDLQWAGIPITYSWPSCASTRLYPADEASIESTVPFLLDFLERLTGRDKLRALHIVCHSMGARALTLALATLTRRRWSRGSLVRHLATLTGGRRSKRPLINEVVLAAPDIDSQRFAQLAAAIRSKCDRITLYASSKDLALVASRAMHAFPRAGESGPDMVVLPELVDTIDATAVDTNLLGHSYYGDERSIIADLFALVNQRQAPENRFGLRQLVSTKGRYWAFQP